LGAAHPLENGFTFDYTTGLPYLPGSSIKGLARQVGRYELDRDLQLRLFGQSDEDELEEDLEATACVGDIVFLPAFPATWPELDVDIINCHHLRYYGSTPSVIGDKDIRTGPIETESPVPVFFLTVAAGTTFILRCTSRSGRSEHVERALDLVAQGLSEQGIGAKTAIGYGVMTTVEE
jgi:CRISPR-associated protein Cmr6